MEREEIVSQLGGIKLVNIDLSSSDKFLETNDNNWYKLCKKEITFKQLRIDENRLQTKEKVEQIKFKI